MIFLYARSTAGMSTTTTGLQLVEVLPYAEEEGTVRRYMERLWTQHDTFTGRFSTLRIRISVNGRNQNDIDRYRGIWKLRKPSLSKTCWAD